MTAYVAHEVPTNIGTQLSLIPKTRKNLTYGKHVYGSCTNTMPLILNMVPQQGTSYSMNFSLPIRELQMRRGIDYCDWCALHLQAHTPLAALDVQSESEICDLGNSAMITALASSPSRTKPLTIQTHYPVNGP